MTAEISQLADRLKTEINHSRLQEITVKIIERFRDKDIVFLADLSRRIGINTENMRITKLFAHVIQVYHPDKLVTIHKQIDALRDTANDAALRKMESTYIFDIKPGKPAPKTIEPFKSADEEYDYGDDDFGYEETVVSEDDYSEWENEEKKDEQEDERPFGINFTEAINAFFFGNLDYTVTVSDLANLDGVIDLSDRDITDLSGLEHCVNLTDLNLSGNSISKIDRIAKLARLKSLYLSENEIEYISALGELHDLEELDISFNNIEDISPLLAAESLLYVNVMSNPLKNRDVVNKLIAKGVIVVYEF